MFEQNFKFGFDISLSFFHSSLTFLIEVGRVDLGAPLAELLIVATNGGVAGPPSCGEGCSDWTVRHFNNNIYYVG